jgi:hypothetical protein
VKPRHFGGLRTGHFHLRNTTKERTHGNWYGRLCGCLGCRHHVNIALTDVSILRRIPSWCRERIKDGLARAHHQTLVASIEVPCPPAGRAFYQFVATGIAPAPKVNSRRAYEICLVAAEAERRIEPVEFKQRVRTRRLSKIPDMRVHGIVLTGLRDGTKLIRDVRRILRANTRRDEDIRTFPEYSNQRSRAEIARIGSEEQKW